MAEINYDENLWFEHLGCNGKHYLLGNPHTHIGRMLAWCPEKNRSFFVSKSEIGELSEQSKYWIQGFLHGNQPFPTVSVNGEVDFHSIEYKTWQKESELFLATGYWWSGEDRFCELCNSIILSSNPNEICLECKPLNSSSN